MICINCMGDADEVGFDIFLGEDGEVVEEFQYLCHNRCTTEIHSKLVILSKDDTRTELYGIYERQNPLERD